MELARAIEILDPEHRELYYEREGGLEEVTEACRMGMEALREAGWISVKDKMPPTGVRVLVCRKTRSGKAVEPGIAGFDGFFTVPVGRTKNVTHWMPMPKAAEV